jgi:hypothetical protein
MTDRILSARRALLLLALLGFFAESASGQWAGSAITHAQELRVDPTFVVQNAAEPRATDVAVTGSLGAVVGFIGGAYLGSQLEPSCDCDDPGLAGALIGSLAGPAIVTPLFAHLANERRGRLGLSYAAAVAIAGLGFVGLGSSLGDSGGGAALVLLGAPLAQVISSTMIEMATTR